MRGGACRCGVIESVQPAPPRAGPGPSSGAVTGKDVDRRMGGSLPSGSGGVGHGGHLRAGKGTAGC